jgi:hypothetical protein
MDAERRLLARRLWRAIRRGEERDGVAFDAMARAVFAYQFARNPVYRAYCQRLGVTPEVVDHWTAVPAVPVEAFRAAPLVCGDPTAAAAVFVTSGTTAGPQRRGRHYLLRLDLYRAAALTWFRRHLVPPDAPTPTRTVALVADVAEAPHSSLACMVAWIRRRWGRRADTVAWSATVGLRWGVFAQALRDAAAAGEPVLLLTTSLALLAALEAAAAEGFRVRLPPGSRLMDTGGAKGQRRSIDRGALYAAVADRFGIPPAWCINEYGMTEMSSQFYDGVAGRAHPNPERRRHRAPPWVRSRAVDPDRGVLLEPDAEGWLRIWDLANLDSVAVLQTADLGAADGRSVRLRGRAPTAEARGCSLAAEAWAWPDA